MGRVKAIEAMRMQEGKVVIDKNCFRKPYRSYTVTYVHRSEAGFFSKQENIIHNRGDIKISA